MRDWWIELMDWRGNGVRFVGTYGHITKSTAFVPVHQEVLLLMAGVSQTFEVLLPARYRLGNPIGIRT
jgi:hypothetical protein